MLKKFYRIDPCIRNVTVFYYLKILFLERGWLRTRWGCDNVLCHQTSGSVASGTSGNNHKRTLRRTGTLNPRCSTFLCLWKSTVHRISSTLAFWTLKFNPFKKRSVMTFRFRIVWYSKVRNRTTGSYGTIAMVQNVRIPKFQNGC